MRGQRGRGTAASTRDGGATPEDERKAAADDDAAADDAADAANAAEGRLTRAGDCDLPRVEFNLNQPSFTCNRGIPKNRP